MNADRARRQLEWALDDHRHFVAFDEDESWAIMHPLACRTTPGSLLACPFNEAMYSTRPSVAPARYVVSLEGGQVTIGGRVADDFDPVMTRIRSALEALREP